MSGLLLAAPVFRAVDASGAPIAGAQLQFYLTGTTTPAAVYSSAALSTPLSNPVVADSGGLFAPMWLDPTVTYRAQLLTAAGALVQDVDPVAESIVEATQAQVNAGTATGLFVSPAKLAAWTGIAEALGYVPLNKGADTANNLQLTFSAYTQTSAGYLGAPVNQQDGSYTLQASDAGKMVRANIAAPATYTIPLSTFQLGCSIVFRNAAASTATLTIAPATSVSLYGAGGATNKSWNLAPGGLAVAFGEPNNAWVISGAGLS